MPRDNNKYFLEVNAIFTLIFAYAYYRAHKEEQYNDFYNYPIKTTYNWTPTVLSSFALLLASTTSLILSLNPGRSNFRESASQKMLDTLTKAGPSIIAIAAGAGCKLANVIAGDRAGAINAQAIIAISVIEQASRFLDKMQEMHAHKIARAIENEETGENHIRYIETIAQRLDEFFTESVEMATQVIWRMALSGLLPRYFPNIDDQNKLSVLAFLYLAADNIESLGTMSINNLALATEIVVDSRYISIFLKTVKLAGTKEYKVEQPEIVTKITSTANGVIAEINEATRMAEEAAERARAELRLRITQAEEKVIKFAHQAEEKMKIFAKKVEEFAHLKIEYEAMSKQFASIKHYLGDSFDKILGALSIQTQWRLRDKEAFHNKKTLLLANRPHLEHKNDAKEEDKEDVIQSSDAVLGHKDVNEEDQNVIQSSAAVLEHKAQGKPKKEGFFHKLFHSHKDDAKEVSSGDQEHRHSIFDNIFSVHKADAKTSKTSNKSSDSKGSADGGKQQSSSSSGGVKKDKADLNEKTLDSGNSYISLVVNKLAEFIMLTIYSTVASKSKILTFSTNKEQEEYRESVKEVEKQLNNTVRIIYEDHPSLEKPANKTQSVNNKAEGCLNDMMHNFDSIAILTIELNSGMFVGEQGEWFNHQNAAMAM